MKKKDLVKGDVIRTNPISGYWGCALVLSEVKKSKDFNARCHIGITPIVFEYEYTIEALDLKALSIMQFDRQIRIDSNTDVPLRLETLIGIYTTRINDSVCIIGNIDVENIYSEPLYFEIGDGSDGGWPLCGPVSKSLGSEAVHTWRAIHDKENWLLDIREAQRSH